MSLFPCGLRLSVLLKRECASAEIPDAEWLKADMYVAALNGTIWERGRVCGDVTSSDVVEVQAQQPLRHCCSASSFNLNC